MEELKLHQFAEKLELRGYSKRTISSYCYDVLQFFAFCESRENLKSLDEVEPAHLTAYHNWLHYGDKQCKARMSTGTVCKMLHALRTFLRVMFAEKLTGKDIAEAVTIPRAKRSIPRRVPTEKEMATLIDGIKPLDPLDKRDRAMFELLYATGLRCEELCTITTGQLDVKEKTLFVRGKGARDRIVPIGEWVMPYLLEYLHTARPLLTHKTTGLLFVSRRGGPLFESNICFLLRKHATNAGLAVRISPHGFRHACATHMLAGGADIRYIQELLGHTALSSTQIYTRVDITMLKQAHKTFHPRERMHDEQPDA